MLNIGGFLAVLIVGILFIPKFYRAGTVTIYGYIHQRLGEPARIACSAMFLIGRILASGARLFIAATPVCLLLFREPQPTKLKMIAAIILIGAIGIAYTTSGGIKAVIWTDSAQIVIVMGAAVLSIYLLLHRIPLTSAQIVHELGLPGTAPGGGSKLHLFETSLDPTKSFTLWTALLANTLFNVASYGVDHDLVQRMLTAKSAWRGSAALILAQVFGMVVAALFMVIGLLLYIYYRRPDLMGNAMPQDAVIATQQVYPRFLLTLHTGFAGLAMAGLFAAAQGSLDSAINAMASSAVADLYWPLRRARGLAVDTTAGSKAPKLAVAGMGIALITFACGCVYLFNSQKDTLLEFALGIMAFAYTGMLGVFLTALLTNRGNALSVIYRARRWCSHYRADAGPRVWLVDHKAPGGATAHFQPVGHADRHAGLFSHLLGGKGRTLAIRGRGALAIPYRV